MLTAFARVSSANNARMKFFTRSDSPTVVRFTSLNPLSSTLDTLLDSTGAQVTLGNGEIIIGAADFNGDTIDKLATRTSNGTFVMHFFDPNALCPTESSRSIVVASTLLENGWQLIGNADLNGDSTADFLLRRNTTGEVRYWVMDGATKVSGGFVKDVDFSWQSTT